MKYQLTYKLPIITLILALFMIPLASFAAEDEDTDNNKKENKPDVVYQSCVDGWIKGLTKAHPDMAAIDIKYVSAYYCVCAINLADSIANTPDPDERQKITFSTCMPYAVLRNTLHYQIESAQGEKMTAGAGTLEGACTLGFPKNVNDKEEVGLIANFCGCAAKPLADIQQVKSTLKENEIRDKVMGIAKDCADKSN